MRIAERSVFDKLRELQRSPSMAPRRESGGELHEARSAELASELGCGPEINDILRMVPEADRAIASGWLRDLDFRTIGDLVGMSPEAVRQRWHRIKLELRSRLKSR
jgi:DNA-directed RNA polymerase specialized sigma24 family protein